LFFSRPLLTCIYQSGLANFCQSLFRILADGHLLQAATHAVAILALRGLAGRSATSPTHHFMSVGQSCRFAQIKRRRSSAALPLKISRHCDAHGLTPKPELLVIHPVNSLVGPFGER
jgi:hypothetical protein